MNFFNILFAIGKLVHLWKQLPKCHGRVAFLAAKHSQIGYIIQTLRGYLRENVKSIFAFEFSM